MLKLRLTMRKGSNKVKKDKEKDQTKISDKKKRKGRPNLLKTDKK